MFKIGTYIFLKYWKVQTRLVFAQTVTYISIHIAILQKMINNTRVATYVFVKTSTCHEYIHGNRVHNNM